MSSPLVSCQSLSKRFGVRPLFLSLSLGIGEGERIGSIGPNGTGKSTLLKILAGLEQPDDGLVSRRRDLRLVYIPQVEDFPSHATVQEILEGALQGDVLEEYERAARLGSALNQVGFERGDQVVGTLSGGWQKRLALAHALIQQPDLILLDEPTNHLDLQGVLWLETLLKTAPFAFLVVSHDRYFLDNVATHILELNRAYPDGYLRTEGAYSAFLTKKADFLEAQAKEQHALEGKVKREIEWLRRGPPARTTKAQSRIQEANRLIDELADVKYRNAQEKTVGVDFSATNRKTRELLVAKGLAKSLGGRPLFSGLNVTLAPGMRLGLLGPNGSGKTTLIRVLTGELEPDAGTIRKTEGLRVVYFDQTRAPLQQETSLRKALCPNGDHILYRDRSYHVAGWAERFLFHAEQLEMPVAALSGGEQARVLIAQLMLRPADLLILDEPTNDLDIPSLEALEDCLTEFPGAVLLVTHDRYLLDSVSTELLALDGTGGTGYFADYAQWETLYREKQAERTRQKAPDRNAPRGPKPSSGLTAQERRELSQMEMTIMNAEEEVAAFQRELEDPAVASDAAKLQAAWTSLQTAQENVTKLYARWEELETKKG